MLVSPKLRLDSKFGSGLKLRDFRVTREPAVVKRLSGNSEVIA